MNKITDFGEKIGGARKDKVQEIKELFTLVTHNALNSQPLSSVFKLPNLRELYIANVITQEQARMSLYLWERLDTKPKIGIQRWAVKTYEILQEIINVLSGVRTNLEDIFNRSFEESAKKLFFEEMAAANWPADDYSHGRYFVGVSMYVDNAYVVRTKLSVKSSHSTILDAVQSIRSLVNAPKGKTLKFEIRKYVSNNELFICPKGKHGVCLRRGILEISEARRIIHEEQDLLRAEYDRLRNIPDERRNWNRPRTGKDYRNGMDMTPEKFSELFPFRGGEFGNWVTQIERVANLNECSDAILDMVNVLGILPEKIAHDGTLAIAFGSRGTGKAMAHYEPGKRVMNFTKLKGAGCFAHEWWHSLDHYIMIKNAQPLLFAIPDYKYLPDNNLKQASQELYSAIKKSPFAKRSNLIDKYKSKKYWGTMIELVARAFETYIFYQLESIGICNDYLVNITSMEEFGRDQCYPYPTKKENDEFKPLFDRLLSIIYQN